MRYGLLVACEEYKNFKNIPYCNNDATLIYNVLCEYCDYRHDDGFRCSLFMKDADYDVNYFFEEIQDILGRLKEGDTFLLYFAGHGVIRNSKGYLILPDTQDEALDDTAISLNKLSSLLEVEGCQTFMVLDACHTGIGARGTETQFSLNEIINNTSVCILASCSEKEESYPDDENEQGAFTYNFAEAIRCSEPNHPIVITDLHTEVCKRMQVWCEVNNKLQTPTLTGNMVGVQCFANRNKKIYEYDYERVSQEMGKTEMKESNIIIEQNEGAIIRSNSLWNNNHGLLLSPRATVCDMVPYATRLRKTEIRAVLENYNNGLYETAADFIWSRAIALLRQRILTLGIDFVSEMVEVYNQAYVLNLPEYEVIDLAADLGFIDKTGRMRLRQSAELIQHFRSRDVEEEEEEMPHNECESVIRASVKYILALDDSQLKTDFAGFRSRLVKENFSDNDGWLAVVKNSPYFYKKTTVRTLVNLLSSTSGAEYQNVEANFNAIMMIIWDALSSDDKYFVGTAYSKANNSGNQTLKDSYAKMLRTVKGFDYVPENLRSLDFVEEAKRIKAVHYGINNYYHEPAAIRKLYCMGTRIPKPALNECVGATLLVYLGNQYGYSYGAEDIALEIFAQLSKDDWEHYIEQCLVYDSDVIRQITAGGDRTKRWCSLANVFNFGELEFSDNRYKEFVSCSLNNDEQGVIRLGKLLSK